jgi:GLPGLI family protein
MKKNITLLLLLIGFFGTSQTVKVDYIEKRLYSQEKFEQLSDFQKAVVSRKKYFTLVNSMGVSLYKYTAGDILDSLKTKVSNADNLGNRNIINSTFIDTSGKIEDFYFKDFVSGNIIFKMLNGPKNFDGKDVFLDWNWTITDEVQQLNGYTCRKAKGRHVNTDYVAWYTEEIAISDGPNRFTGLPGLIVYVSNPYFEYFATTIVVDNTNTIIETPSVATKTYTFSEINNYVKKNIPNNSTRTEGNTTIQTITIGQ